MVIRLLLRVLFRVTISWVVLILLMRILLVFVIDAAQLSIVDAWHAKVSTLSWGGVPVHWMMATVGRGTCDFCNG